ncbi:MAG: SGNH/GDSL hydrolase family protein [Turicibacter sp.]|nr:SGNH/GDSL hydrolase family protein [Turicibacter sp.]
MENNRENSWEDSMENSNNRENNRNWQNSTSIGLEQYIKIGIAVLAVAVIAVVVYFAFFRPSAHIYIALGDSVSSGYGFEDNPENRHTYLFFEKLQQAGYADEYYNFATSGFTTADVLEMLNDMDNEEIRLFRRASVITLNIGGNNVLTPFLGYLSELQAVSGGENVATGAGQTLSGAWGVMYEIIAGVNEIVETEGGGFDFGRIIGSFNVDNIVGGFGDMLSGLGGILFGTAEIVAGSRDIFSIWTGSLSPELEALLDEGVENFAQEFGEIITWLERNAPRATIIVNTIYNPIPQEILRISVPMATWSNELLADMNQVIIEESSGRFLVADVNNYLSGRLDLVRFNLNPFTAALSFDLVHPNEEGHLLIADVGWRVLVEE